MNNITTLLVLSAVLIAAVVSGCVQMRAVSEIGAQDATPPGGAL